MKNRVLSGIVLVALMVAIVLFNESFPLALNIVLALVSLLSITEIISAIGMTKKYFLAVPSVLFAAGLPLVDSQLWQEGLYFVYTSVLFASMILYHKETTFREVSVIYSMTLLIPTALMTLLGLRELGGAHGMFYVMMAVFSAWIADAGAFFAGSLFGKHKLCPEISPKKTIEGAAGGFVLNIAAMLVFGWLFSDIYYQGTVQVSYLTLLLMGVGCTVFSMLGDLSFSLIKRSCHIKDFGQVIPGHGGILDRFDSVIFTVPFVFFLVQIIPLVS